MGEEHRDQSIALKGSLDSSATPPCKNDKLSYSREFLLSFAELNSCKKQPNELGLFRKSEFLTISRNAKHSYSREFLLSFAELKSCKKQPSGLDPQVLRDRVPPQAVEAAASGSSISTKGLIRRDKDGDGSGEAFQNIPEWRRPQGNTGGPISQGSRRGEQGGASFPNSHQRNNYDKSGWQGPGSGGGQGRWEHRSGGGDRDRDRSRYDRDVAEQDSGRRSYGSDNLSHQGGMPPEHDGLLGSGGSLRSSRSSGGTMVSNIQGHDRYHPVGRMNHNNESYFPPRALKTSSHSRRDNTDSFNDETFGTDVISNQERFEQERKRRDSFELMRKEQQKVLHEKQKLNARKQDERCTSESVMASDKKHEEERFWEDGRNLEVHTTILSTTSKAALPMVTVPRPLVPPGFTKVLLEKQVNVKSANRQVVPEVSNTEITKDDPDATTFDTPLDDVNGNQVKEGLAVTLAEGRNKQELWSACAETSLAATVAVDLQIPPMGPEISDSPTIGNLDIVSNTMKADSTGSLPEIKQNVWSLGFDDALGGEKVAAYESRGNSIQERPEIILDRLFGKASVGFDRGEDPLEVDESQMVNGDSNLVPKKSKFARWFHTEEEKPKDDMSVCETSDILSLLSKSEKSTLSPSASEERAGVEEAPNSPLSSIFPFRSPCRVLPMPAGPSLEDVEKIMTANANANGHDEMGQSQLPGNQIFDSSGLQFKVDISPDNSLKNKDHQYSNPSRLPRMALTCEDVEQSIIAEVGESVAKVQQHSGGHTVSVGNMLTSEERGCRDNHASQHILSLLMKGSNTKDQMQSTMQVHDERCIVFPEGKDCKDNPNVSPTSCCNAEQVEIPERTGGAHTLEFLFGKAFMKELRSVEAPVSVKTLPNDTAGKADGVESSLNMLSWDRQNILPSSNIETAIGKQQHLSAPRKTSIKEGKSRQSSLDSIAYAPDWELQGTSSNLSHGNQSTGNSQLENANVLGNGSVPIFGSAAKALPNLVSNGAYSGSSTSDFDSEFLEVTSAFHEQGNSIMRDFFDSGRKELTLDAGNMSVGHSFMGQDDRSIDIRLQPEESSTVVGISSSSGNSLPPSILDVFPKANLGRNHLSDDFLVSDITGTMPDKVQKLASFTDGKNRYEDHNRRGHDSISQHYRGADASVLESRISLNEMMRGSPKTSYPTATLVNSIPHSGGVDPSNLASNGIQQLFGLSPSQPSPFSQQQVHAPPDLSFKSHSLQVPHGRPPPLYPFHHGAAPYDINLGGINGAPHQQLNPLQALKNQQMKSFSHGSSLEQHPGFEPWSDHLSGRSFSQEPSGQMLFPHQNVPPMTQPVYPSLRPHGYAPNHFVQPVQMPQGGLSYPSVNNIPFIPEQLPHGPHGLPSNYAHFPGGFMPDIPVQSMQCLQFHHKPSHNTIGQLSGTSQNQLVRPVFGAPSDFNAPGNARFDGSGHAGAMGNNGAVLDMLFGKESRRQPTGPVPFTQYPYGLEQGGNMGYG